MKLNEVVQMNNSVKHRGPDDEGYALFNLSTKQVDVWGGIDTPTNIYRDNCEYCPKDVINESLEVSEPVGYLAFGHRRLSILDLSPKGHQPMCDRERAAWIIHNGEIYNFIELKEELLKLGHTFVSNTDTEVILAAYKEWGEACQDRFNGMWSFIIFDLKKQKLFASRDRFGIKPLYYVNIDNNIIAFASEIKQILHLKNIKAKINIQKVYDYLKYACSDHTSETLFGNINQIRGGQCASISLDPNSQDFGKMKIRTWWRITRKPTHDISINDASAEFKKHLLNSVKFRLRSDVPIGSCLSGGLDSSAIVCIVNQLLEQKGSNTLQKTFSSCFVDKKYDEREYISLVADKTSIEPNYIFPNPKNLFQNLDEIIYQHDEPIGSTSIFAQWSVFKLAASHNIKVILDGQGSDEYLAGYHSYYYRYFQYLFKTGKLISLFNEMRLHKLYHNYPMSKSIAYVIASLVPRAMTNYLNGNLEKLNNPRWLNWNSWKKKGASPTFRNSIKNSDSNNIFNEIIYLRLFVRGLPMLLHWEDRNSMTHSIESRVPFLDHNLVQFTYNLPENFIINNGLTKYILRKSMKGILPNKIINRKDKMGFVTPEEMWLKEDLTDEFKSELNELCNRLPDLFNKKALIHFYRNTKSGRAKFDFTIWRLISLNRWIKRYDVQF